MAQITLDTDKMVEVGIDTNVRVSLVGTSLVLVIDTTKDLGLSSTGKMRAVANTGGFQTFPSGLKGNVYIGKKP